MNKTQLIEEMSICGNMTKVNAKKALDTVTTTLTNILSRNESVSIPGFGSFSVRDRTARDGRNPKTGETIKIAATKVPAFKAGKNLKDAVVLGDKW